MGLLICFVQIALLFNVSKWIREPEKRALLVTVFQSIMEKHREKPCSKGKIHDFCDLALKENLLPGDFMELQQMLQEISNMESRDNTVLPIRWFLGHSRPIIGGTRRNYWNRAKMENFLLHVNRWNGKAKDASSFQNIRFPLTSDDMRQGHNAGPIREVEMYQTAANGGQLPDTPRSSSDARSIALTTPRNQWKEAAARSVGSTPLNSPRGHGSLASSSSSVGSTPLNSPRGHLCTAPPLQRSLIIEWFMSMNGQSLNAEMKEVCKGLTYSNPLLVQISDVVRLHQIFFHEMTLNSPVTQKLFLEKLSNCALIQRTLRANTNLFRSIEHVAFADEIIQMMFLEGLVSSFYQEVWNIYLPSRQYILGISKISPKQNGNFLIEFLPDEMIQDYLDQFRPSIIGELPPIA